MEGEDCFAEMDIYCEQGIDRSMDEDEISWEEQGFMRGWLAA